MAMTTLGRLFAAAAMVSSVAAVTRADDRSHRPKANISFIQIDKDITLRRMVVHNPEPRDTGHYPHLQRLERTVEEVRASFR